MTFPKGDPVPPSNDLTTQANYHDIQTEHLHLEWEVDWPGKVFRGSVLHTMRAQKSGVTEVTFDTSYLAILRISLGKKELGFTVSPRHDVLGSKLTVQLKETLSKGDVIDLLVEYELTKACTALGWLEARQTGSGKYPFLYSQCQAIHCRSLVPIHDTPAVKSTYSASVKSTLPILMSALRTSPPLEQVINLELHETVTYKFDQPIAIPSYLIAIAGGEVAFAPLGKRTGVWIEPKKLEAAVWEFEEDTERYLLTAEKLTTEYVWGRYDVLVLPQSFPYGGMENANCTFLTPALITGDRTEVDVISHEIMHSWFGNLIGVANWDSFWLNEGWTTYTERLIARELHGEPSRAFEYIIGNKGLNDALEKYGASNPKYQRLHIPYEFGEDPDEAYSSIAYDKGAQFLLHLERVSGGLKYWIPYMKAYVKRFRGLSITTEDWEKHFWDYWSADPALKDSLAALKKVDFDAWLNGEGASLPVKLDVDTSLADHAYTLAAKWDKARNGAALPFSKDDIKDFSAKQVSLLLDTLVEYPALSSSALDKMDDAYELSSNGNPEINLRWYSLTLKAGFHAEEAAKWVENQGRMKYCRPIYKAIHKVNPELAKKTFIESGVNFLHPIARRIVAMDLGLSGY